LDAHITTGFLFIQPFYDLAFNILVVFYRLFGENFGVAVIVFTLVLKFATLPFSIRQANSAAKSKEFQTKYKEIQNKHKNAADKEAMTKELAQLQSEYLPAQLGGCLPLILQLLFFFQVYYVVINSLKVGTAAFNAVNYSFIPDFAEGAALHLDFLGLNLGQIPSAVGFGDLGAILPYLVLVALVGISQFVSGRVMSGLSLLPAAATEKLSKTKQAKLDKKAKSEKTAKPNKEEKKQPEDMSFSEAMQQSSQTMLYVLPLMTMLLSFSFPAGLSLYWTVTSGFAVVQQLVVNRAKVREWLRNRFNAV
jgi:YidC/Oxa1 family membrane protein insertase